MTIATLLAHGSSSTTATTAVVAVLWATQALAILAARRRLGRNRPGLWRIAVFGAGGAVVLAVSSPALPVEERLSAHMLQHALLVGLAAPLFALGLPATRLLCLLAPRVRRRVHDVVRRLRLRGGSTAVVLALTVHLAVVSVWHVPVLYEAALAHERLHAAEHALFTGTAALLWLALVGEPARAFAVARLVGLTVLALHGALLGALLAFSSRAWYGAYAQGPSDALADQQVAGLLMWSLGGVSPVVAAFVLVAYWLGEDAGASGRQRGVDEARALESRSRPPRSRGRRR